MFRRFLDSALSFTTATAILIGPVYVTAPEYAHAQSPCTSLLTPRDVVACEQARQGGANAMHASRPDHENVTLTVLRQTAASLNARGFDGGPFGVLVKDGGTNCSGYACDIICAGQGASQRQWDVFGDVNGASSPDWSGPLDPIVVRPCEFVAGVPPTVPPTPPTPAPDLTEILKRLDAIEQSVAALKGDTTDIRAVLAAESRDIRAIIAALPPAGAVDCSQLPTYRGSAWFGSVISRPQCK